MIQKLIPTYLRTEIVFPVLCVDRDPGDQGDYPGDGAYP